MKPQRAIVIDANAMEVREIDLPDRAIHRLAVINRAVGGYVEIAYRWPSGDILMVDEDGLRHSWPFGFLFIPTGKHIIGSGIVVGREIERDDDPDGYVNADPKISQSGLRTLVRYFRRLPP